MRGNEPGAQRTRENLVWRPPNFPCAQGRPLSGIGPHGCGTWGNRVLRPRISGENGAWIQRNATGQAMTGKEMLLLARAPARSHRQVTRRRPAPRVDIVADATRFVVDAAVPSSRERSHAYGRDDADPSSGAGPPYPR